MKKTLRLVIRTLRALLVLLGLLLLVGGAIQFTNLPWWLYDRLNHLPRPAPEAPPSVILLMGGSGIPGDSGLMRTFYGAEAARLFPAAELLVAMPLDADESVASRAYLDELLLRGAAADHIRILPLGRNTREQALRLADWLATTPAPHRVLIVTDPEHVRRTAAAVRRACADRQIPVELTAMAADPVSLEDPLPWRAAELSTAPPAAPSRRGVPSVPDIGPTIHLRYNLWNNLNYSQRAFREYAALLYYRLQGWL